MNCWVRLWLIACSLSQKSVLYLQEDSILASVSGVGMVDGGLRLLLFTVVFTEVILIASAGMLFPFNSSLEQLFDIQAAVITSTRRRPH